jgi:indolepyruvate ferredoxin oxidoreductase
MKAFTILAKFKFLRGTALDMFGYTSERKQERADVDEYRQLLDTLLSELDENNYGAALELARLAEKLRGYGHVKDRNREMLAVRKADLVRKFRGEQLAVEVEIVDAA